MIHEWVKNRISCRLLSSFILVNLFVFSLFGVCKSETTIINVPPENNKILLNPGMGFTILAQDWYKEYDWYKGIINIAYMRFRWAELEPEEGKCNFRIITDWMQRWRKAGYRVALGVKSTDTVMTSTPNWVFEAGVPGPYHRGGKQRDPVYWHPLYMEKYEKFVRNLGQFFDGMEGLEYVDMRGIGVWGEMHLGTFMDGMWTKDELSFYGFTVDKYKEAYRRMIDIYRSAFTKTALFLNIGQYDDLTEYAAKKGIGLRYDGLTWKLRMNEMPIVSKNFRKYGYNNGELPIGVRCHYEFAEDVRDPELFQKTLDIALSDPVSYIPPNPGPLNRVIEANKAIIKKAAARIGYRFTLDRFEIGNDFEISRSQFINLPTNQYWINKGVAPCYKNYNLAYVIMNKEGKIICEENFSPEPATVKWSPSTTIVVNKIITLPGNIPTGEYYLKLFMFDPQEPLKKIKLGISGEDADGLYTIAKINIENQRDKKTYLRISGVTQDKPQF